MYLPFGLIIGSRRDVLIRRRVSRTRRTRRRFIIHTNKICIRSMRIYTRAHFLMSLVAVLSLCALSCVCAYNVYPQQLYSYPTTSQYSGVVYSVYAYSNYSHS